MKLRIFLFCLPFIGFGQEIILSVSDYNNYDFQRITNEIHFFVDDSVYILTKGEIKKHQTDRFEKKDLRIIEDSIFQIAGGGTLFKMNHEYQFEKIVDKPNMEQSFFQSASFIRQDTIYQFGGYGNFSHKNDLIFYDSNLNTWEYYPYSSNNKIKPPNAAPEFFAITKDQLLIAGLYGEADYGTQTNNILKPDIWGFSFVTRQWKQLGSYDFLDAFKNKINHFYNIGNQYYARTSFDTTLLIDFENNTWEEFQDITSIKSKLRGMQKIGKTYFILSQSNGNTLELIRVKQEYLFSKKLQSGNILVKDKSLAVQVLFLVLFLAVILLIYYLFRQSKRNNRSVLIHFRNQKIQILSKNEIQLIDDLLKEYPNAVSFKTIGTYFDKNLNFETIKVKTRKLILLLNQKIKAETRIEALIEVRKSKEDRRAREVFIKSK